MTWIYLSPHLDDVALSCGGLVGEQTQAGIPVEIWTICAGDPPDRPLSAFARELHKRWQTGQLPGQASSARRQEDIAACRRLSAGYRHFPYADCIYRGDPQSGADLYPDRQAIFGALHSAESGLVETLQAELCSLLPEEATLVCPLAIGGHVDHRLVRLAASGMISRGCASRLPGALWYYADYPYAREAAGELAALERAGYERRVFPISAAGMDAWAAAVAAHTSQISSFWPDLESMRVALQAYEGLSGGIALWKPPSARL
jgi:LmbE family N-acetylglucosaminyl deacetylase